MMTKLLLLMVLFPWLPNAVYSQTSDTLDLTTLAALRSGEPPKPIKGPALGIPVEAQRKDLPLDITLESLDRDSYQEGDQYFVRIILKNPGKQSVTLPWDPDSRHVEDVDVPYRWESVLSLRLEGVDSVSLRPIAALFGSNQYPGTVHEIQPGGRAEIIARGGWLFLTTDSADRMRALLPADVSVRATLMFVSGVGGHVYREKFSSNQVQIHLDRHRQY